MRVRHTFWFPQQKEARNIRIGWAQYHERLCSREAPEVLQNMIPTRSLSEQSFEVRHLKGNNFTDLSDHQDPSQGKTGAVLRGFCNYEGNEATKWKRWRRLIYVKDSPLHFLAFSMLFSIEPRTALLDPDRVSLAPIQRTLMQSRWPKPPFRKPRFRRCWHPKLLLLWTKNSKKVGELWPRLTSTEMHLFTQCRFQADSSKFGPIISTLENVGSPLEKVGSP